MLYHWIKSGPPYSYTCKASFLHRRVRSNAHLFPRLCLPLIYSYSRYLQGFAYLLQRHCLLLQRCDHKKGYVTPAWNSCSLFSRQVLHTLCQFISFKFRRQCLIWKISSLKKGCNAFFKCSFCIFSTKVLHTIFSANLWIEKALPHC